MPLNDILMPDIEDQLSCKSADALPGRHEVFGIYHVQTRAPVVHNRVNPFIGEEETGAAIDNWILKAADCQYTYRPEKALMDNKGFSFRS
jgi:hypothetical protein